MAEVFQGGEKLIETLKRMADRLGNEPHVRVGFMEGSVGGKKANVPAPSLAAILEYGNPAGNLPPRPFFRNMITEHSNEWPALIKLGLKKFDLDSKLALAMVGQRIGEQLQLSMTNFTTPGNKDWVWRKGGKGFDKPLEWSKKLKLSVSFQVHAGGEEEKSK
jgi:hypothetical protein